MPYGSNFVRLPFFQRSGHSGPAHSGKSLTPLSHFSFPRAPICGPFFRRRAIIAAGGSFGGPFELTLLLAEKVVEFKILGDPVMLGHASLSREVGTLAP